MKKKQLQHEVKSWPEFFEPLIRGEKRHDLRRADDRRFQVGDLVLYREWDPATHTFTGRKATAKITYMTSASAPCALSREALEQQHCILSVEVLDSSDSASVPLRRQVRR